MIINSQQQIVKQFSIIFSYESTLSLAAPGRINLIGEHTDYNNGFVLPAAIDKKIYFAFAKNNTNEIRLVALDKQESYNFEFSKKGNIPKSGWQKYVVGMINTFLKPGQGFDVLFGGNLPHGAGMSSSSALCCGLAYGLNLLFELGYSKAEMVPLIQKAEAICSGVNGGIMDQFAIMMGQKDKAILLDCQSLAFGYIPLELQQYCLLLCNTQVEHELASTEYNNRRKECEIGVALLQEQGIAIDSLRDLDLNILQKHQSLFDPIVFKRCAYVVRENQRVLKAEAALKKGDLNTLGALIYQSHEGLQQYYAVSCTELDFLVAFAKTQKYVLGARMMGGGFGGCTINLLPKDKVANFLNLAGEAYLDRFGKELLGYEVVTGEFG